MIAIYRPCLCVFFVIGCMSLGEAEEKLGPKRAEYDQWIRYYTEKLPTKGRPLKLAVTAIEHDEPQANSQDQIYLRQISYGCDVFAGGRVYNFTTPDIALF